MSTLMSTIWVLFREKHEYYPFLSVILNIMVKYEYYGVILSKMMSNYMSTLMSTIWVQFWVKTWVLSVFKCYFKYYGKIWVLWGYFK